MDEWKKKSLPAVFWFQEGPGVRKWQFTSSGIKLLNVANITTVGELDLSKTERYLSRQEVLGRYSHFLVDAGDLIIASSGIAFDQDGLLRTRGAFARQSHLPLCMNTSTIRFKSKGHNGYLPFLKYWLDSFEFRSQITRLVTGSAQQNFGPSHLESIVISLPDLAEQKRVAASLDRADRLRRLRRFGLEMADELLANAFRRMFVDQKGDWPVLTVEQLALPKRGSIRTGPFGSQLLHSEFTSSGIAVLGIDNVVQNRFAWGQRRFVTPEKYDALKRYTIAPGDVLISIMGTCGRCAVVPDNIPLAINTKHLCCISLDQSKCLPEYLHACFLNHPVALRSLASISTGTN